MKKFIFCLVVMFAMVVSSNAQITSSKMSSERSGKVTDFNEPYPFSFKPCGDIICVENMYIMRFYSPNILSSDRVIVPLGESKKEAIETLNGLIGILSNVNNKDYACVNLANGKSITIHKYYDVWCIDQEGIDKGSFRFSTNGFNKNTFEKCIKEIEAF